MYANQLGINLWRMAGLCVAMAVVAFALPAQSQVVVQYTGSIVTGFGDGPPPSWFPTAPMTPTMDLTWDTANNGQPACKPITPAVPFFGTKGSATAAITGFVGTAAVTTKGAAPRAVQFKVATLPWMGANTLCTVTQTQIPNFLTIRRQQTYLQWPGSTATFSAGGGFAGTTGAPFLKVAPFNTAQSVIASTLPGGGASPKFGGALRVNGVSNTLLGILTPGLNVFTGTLPIKLFIGAQGGGMTPTLQTTTSAPFRLKGKTAPTIPGAARQLFFPWTTGKIVASDRAGNFWTFRQRSGYDNRSGPNSSMGTLQLVSPALTDIQGLAPLPFAITSVLNLKFLGAPEPGATLLLGAGVVTLLGLCAAHRRRS